MGVTVLPRWRAAVLAAPLLIAGFAASPAMAQSLEGSWSGGGSVALVLFGIAAPIVVFREIGRFLRYGNLDALRVAFQKASPSGVAILGGVGRPGYYNVPADILLSDALMLAGGPGGNVRLDKSKVQRLGTEIYDADAVQYALNQGVTLDRMSLVGGDVVEIGQDKLGRTETSLRTFGYLLAIPLSIAGVIALF